ncbi:MAG: hypothetical protein ACYTF6_04160 [Planctomycetota bacterium]
MKSPNCCRGALGRPARLKVADVTSVPKHVQERARRFVESMSSEERMLVVLNRELYDGAWEEMMADLKARLEGGPFIFKLAHRITDDLGRIEKLREFERSTGVALIDYVEPKEKPPAPRGR